MYVAGLFKSPTSLLREPRVARMAGALVSEVSAWPGLVSLPSIAIYLTSFGFTLGKSRAGGARERAGKGGLSSVLFGGERA